MPTYGGFETVTELHRGALGAVWSARRAGTTQDPAFAVRTCRPDGAILGEARAAAALEAFLARANAQQKAARSVPIAESRWAQVYEIGRIPATPAEPAGVFMVTDLATRGTVERLTSARTQIDARTLATIVDGVVAGLRQINTEAGGARAHGRLEPSNVLLVAGSARGRFSRVALADPAAELPADHARAAHEDLQALGRLIHLLVLHEPFRGQLPLEPGPAWDRLGKSGTAWRELTERLLERTSSPIALEELLARVKALRRMRRSRAPLLAAAAALVLIAGGIGVFVLAEKARQRQAAPLPETLWNPAAAARWTQLCDAYRTWYGSLLTRLEQRPPTASAQHKTRRAWYAALDKDLGSILSPHALVSGKGTDPWTLAGVEAGADLTTLAASPTPRARSDASVEKTRAALEAIEKLRAELPERWPALARFREIAQTWESRGWKQQAAYVRRIAQAASPADPGSADLAASFDELLRTRTIIERIESRWGGLRQTAEGIAAGDDPVLKGTPAALNAMVVPAPAASGVDAGGLPTRDDVMALERNIDSAAELAARLQTFLVQEWSGIDVDSFRSGERYAQLAAAPASADTLEGWLFEVRGHARLDPALDPRAGWDDSTLFEPVNAAVAELAKPLLSTPVDPATAQRIADLRADAAALAPAKLPWNRRNRDRIESDSVRIRRDAAAIQADLERRIAVRMQELATTAEQVREQLRGRAAISPESPALNAAWVAGRDRLLAVHTGIDFEALKQAARNLEGELNWVSAAFGAAAPADDFDGRIRRAPGVKGAPWALRIAQTVSELRERAIADALAAAGNAEDSAFRARVEPLARAFRTRIDELAAQVVALEAVQVRLDAADPLADESGAGGPGRLGRAQQALDQLAGRSAAVAEALSELRERLAALAAIAREGSSAALVTRIREARPDRPEAALASLRRLGSPEIAWPATADELKDGAAVRDALLRVAASVQDSIRRDELTVFVRAELAARWTALAVRTADAASFEPVALAAPDFAVQASSLTPALRYNVALTLVRRALARPGVQEDAVRQVAAAFVAEVRSIPQLPPAANSRLTQVTGLIDGSQPEPPSIDPLTLGPGSVGWRGEADESGKLTFTSGNAKIEFLRLEVQRGGEVVPVYFGVSEVSVGTFARVVAQARAQEELRQALQVFDPGTATWAGPRAWTWSATRTVVPGPLWLKLDANVNAQRPAYPASLLRPGDFRLIRDEAGGEPNSEHPMQQISPAAAALVARLAGCRIPATDEWRAARAMVPAASDLSEWNLRDATFAAQKNHIRAMQAQVVNKASFPWPDANILLPDQPKVPVQDRATSHEFDDGVLWFAPCSADARHAFQHLIGNVAELVFDQPDRMDAAKPTTESVLSVLQQHADGLAAIGGSALAPPELSPETRIPVDLLFSTEGFADVGFRMAFTARGTRPPRETLASKVLRVLTPDSYIFASR